MALKNVLRDCPGCLCLCLTLLWKAESLGSSRGLLRGFGRGRYRVTLDCISGLAARAVKVNTVDGVAVYLDTMADHGGSVAAGNGWRLTSWGDRQANWEDFPISSKTQIIWQ